MKPTLAYRQISLRIGFTKWMWGDEMSTQIK